MKKEFILLNILGVISLIFLFTIVWKETTPEWKKYQKEYYKELEKRTGKKVIPRYKINQIWIKPLNRCDRCTTCHMAIDNPKFKDAKNPHKTHPGNFLKTHPKEKFGCSICHEGQGRTLTFVDAGHVPPLKFDKVEKERKKIWRGEKSYIIDFLRPDPKKIKEWQRSRGFKRLKHWERSMLPKELCYATCSMCHSEAQVFKNDLPNCGLLKKGADLIMKRVCFKCHKIDGIGGSRGPELTGLGSKSPYEFILSHDYSNVYEAKKDKSFHNYLRVINWIYEHFKCPTDTVGGDPEKGALPPKEIGWQIGKEKFVVLKPQTSMPDFKFSDEEALALTIYILSLRKEDLPSQYVIGPIDVKNKTKDPAILYSHYCTRCHGKMQTYLGSRDTNVDIGPSLNYQPFLAMATISFLKESISEGRGGRPMIAWNKENGGLTDEQINNLVNYIKSFQKLPFKGLDPRPIKGDVYKGKDSYNKFCAKCHGKYGDGSCGYTYAYAREQPPTVIGPAIINQDFLKLVGNDFIKQNVLSGRCGREILSLLKKKKLAEGDIDNIVAWIRTWEIKGDVEEGKFWYEAACARCHGKNGQGIDFNNLKRENLIDPLIGRPTPFPINTSGYLRTASDNNLEGITLNELRNYFEVYNRFDFKDIDFWLVDPEIMSQQSRIIYVDDIIAFIRTWERPTKIKRLSDVEIKRFYKEARLAMDEKKYSIAEKILKDIIKSHPIELDAHIMLAKVCLVEDRFEEAIYELMKAVMLNPRNADVHFMLADTYARQGKEEKATIEYKRSFFIEGVKSKAFGRLMELKKYREIIDVTKTHRFKIRKLYQPQLHYHLGLIYRDYLPDEEKDTEKARYHFKKYLKIHRDLHSDKESDKKIEEWLKSNE